MAKIKRMDQIRRILQTYLDTRSIKATATRLRVSKNTVREYKRRTEEYDSDLAVVLALDDEALRPLQHEPAVRSEEDPNNIMGYNPSAAALNRIYQIKKIHTGL